MARLHKIDTRLPDDLWLLVDSYARQAGLKRTQVVVEALESYFGLGRVDPVAFARETTPPAAGSNNAPASMPRPYPTKAQADRGDR